MSQTITQSAAATIRCRADCGHVSNFTPTFFMNGLGTWRDVYWFTNEGKPFVLVDESYTNRRPRAQIMSPISAEFGGHITLDQLSARAPALARRVILHQIEWLEAGPDEAGYGGEIANLRARLEVLEAAK